MKKRRKLNVWWSEWKFYIPPAISTVASLLSYYVGWLMSSPGDRTPFARSGAAATAVCIEFTVWNYGEILRDGQQKGLEAYANAVRSMNLSFQDPDKLVADFTQRLAAQTKEIGRRVTIWHASLLAAGTIVWGSGDLIGQQ